MRPKKKSQSYVPKQEEPTWWIEDSQYKLLSLL